MTRRDGAETRKQSIQQVAQCVQAALHRRKDSGETEEIPLSKTIAHLALQTGLTKEKIREYLEILQDDDQFELDSLNDKIKRV
jgi:hypothetical protein